MIHSTNLEQANQNLKLSENEIRHVAKLANLDLSNEEVEKFQKQLSEVLDYVEVLNELNTDNVEPTSQVTGLENVTREDEVKSSLTLEEALSGAPKTEKEMFETQAVFQNKDEF